jgi:hypothetical protein
MSDFQAKILICKECGEEFVFTADAQEHFSTRRLTLLPKLCKLCHIAARKPPVRRHGRRKPARNGNTVPQQTNWNR